MLWSTNQGATLIGDVTYRRHGWKIECEKCGEFADTVFIGSRFEIPDEGAVQRSAKPATMNVPLGNQPRVSGIGSKIDGGEYRLGKCVW